MADEVGDIGTRPRASHRLRGFAPPRCRGAGEIGQPSFHAGRQVSIGGLPSASQHAGLVRGTCGLAIGHLLQITYRPVLIMRPRSATGGWTPLRIEASRSRGELASTGCSACSGDT
jgi:hypothetical protein